MRGFPLLDKAQQERWDAARLAPYGTAAMNSRGRRYAEGGSDPRTAFQRDRDRILHSAAFRRLQYKTQVYVFHEGDFYRTRLTHSLEVAQIGAALAHMVGANPDLTWAISLAHDLGHPPFGHGGEDELNRLMADEGGFEHNEQALRIVDELEIRYPDFPGLNLTWEVREGIARHATFFDDPRVPDEFAAWPQPGLEAQLSNLADMIAYCTHDLEDALAAGFLREEELERDIELWREVPSPAPGYAYTTLAEREMARRFRVRALIDRLIRAAVEETVRRLERYGLDSPDAVRRHPEPVAAFPDDMWRKLVELKDYLYERVYYDPRVVRMVHKGRMVLRKLFEAFSGNPKLLPLHVRERLAAEGIPLDGRNEAADAGAGGRPGPSPSLKRFVCDYLSLMTDRHAMDLYNTLFEPYESSLHGPV